MSKFLIINVNWNMIRFEIFNFFPQKNNFAYIFENYVNRIKL